MDKIDETLNTLRVMFERNHQQVTDMLQALASIPAESVTADDVRRLAEATASEQATMLGALALLTRCVMDMRRGTAAPVAMPPVTPAAPSPTLN